MRQLQAPSNFLGLTEHVMVLFDTSTEVNYERLLNGSAPEPLVQRSGVLDKGMYNVRLAIPGQLETAPVKELAPVIDIFTREVVEAPAVVTVTHSPVDERTPEQIESAMDARRQIAEVYGTPPPMVLSAEPDHLDEGYYQVMQGAA